MLYAAIITTLVVVIGISDELTLQWQMTRAIITGPLVGLLLGDVQTGLYIGATIELMFLSNVIVGAAEIPDVTMASAIATALCITSHVPTEVAIALSKALANNTYKSTSSINDKSFPSIKQVIGIFFAWHSRVFSVSIVSRVIAMLFIFFFRLWFFSFISSVALSFGFKSGFERV